jgi:hypothetical protein
VPDGTVDPDDDDTQAFYWIPSSPYLCQYPVVEATPFGFTYPQPNLAFTPVVRLIELSRNIPYSSVLNNPYTIQLLIGNGGLVVIDDTNRLGLFMPRLGG